MYLPKLKAASISIKELAATSRMFYRPLKDIPFYKVYRNEDEAIWDIQDGAHINAASFGFCSVQENLISALIRKGNHY